ncbi:sulfatase family protein [Flavicella sediminum]|uniref:sulfatase family protein n=1 Tax=Flavicella sediminum TaxID=2585141 RepID=UPI00111E84E8|nr:arylsulfatase [Flavicella sediminum]
MNFTKILLVASLCLANFQLVAQERPNIVVILADDIGLGDISYYRKQHNGKIIVETPTLDQLAKNGMVFTDAHAPAALCAPSRYAIMTGTHCFRSPAPWGVWGSYQESPIHKNQLTLGKIMKQAGYKTGFFGKWHIGGDYKRKSNPSEIYRSARKKPELDVDIRQIVGGGPQQNGFDYSFTFPAGIQDVPYAVFENGTMMPLHKDSKITHITYEAMKKIGVKLDKDDGLGDSHWNPHDMGPLLVKKAVQFIEDNSHKKAPFFMYYCSQAVHKPHTPSKILNGKKIAGTTPSKHLDMVKEMDVQMEMLVESLKEKGIFENTLFIFTSDNGGLQIKESMQSGHRSSDIYRGGKNQAYEGGTRVPFIAHWPTKIKKRSTSEIPVLGLDILATVAEVAGQPIEEKQAMDSSSMLSILLNESDKNLHPFLITQAGTSRQVMITEDHWKLIIQLDKKDKTDKTRTPSELYNLKDNPTENKSKNLVNNPKHRNKVLYLFNKYNKYRDLEL